MPQERRSEIPESDRSPRRERGLVPFQPQTVKTGIELYQETPDLDQRALILNTRIVQVDPEANTATADTIRAITILVEKQQTGMTTYRSDAVAGLNSGNLVAILNGITEDVALDPLSQALSQIEHAREESTMSSVGYNPGKETLNEVGGGLLEDEIIAELSERLMDDTISVGERRELITAIQATVTPAGLRRIIQYPEVLSSLAHSVQEFDDTDFRNFLLNLIQSEL